VFSEVDPTAAATESGFDSVSFDAALECVNGLNFQLQKTNAAGRFEWNDGFLVDALQVWQRPSLFIFHFILFYFCFRGMMRRRYLPARENAAQLDNFP
jgi:hypothetical protein